MILRFAPLIGEPDFSAIISRSAFSFASRSGVTARADSSSVARRLRSSVSSWRQRTRSTSLSRTLTLRPTRRLSKSGSSTSTSAMSSSSTSVSDSTRSKVASTPASSRSRVSPKEVDGALKPLEHVDPHQVDEALLTIHLPEIALSLLELRPIKLFVCLPFVRQHVAEGRVGCELEPPDLLVYLSDGRELAREVDLGLEVDRLQPLGKAPVSSVP